MNCFVLLNTKEDILKHVGNRAVLGHHWLFFCFGSQWYPKTAWLQTFFRISSFVFGRTKTFISLDLLEVSKLLQNFHFWVNYPFKTSWSTNSLDFKLHYIKYQIFSDWLWLYHIQHECLCLESNCTRLGHGVVETELTKLPWFYCLVCKWWHKTP